MGYWFRGQLVLGGLIGISIWIGLTLLTKIVDWYMDGKIRIDDLITHRLKLEDINTGFDLMKSGESIRSVVMY